MADLLSVPLKKPTDVDLVSPLKNVIKGSFSTADNPEDYTDKISEFNRMRNTAVWRVFEKYESSLEVIYSYYDQLVDLEGKLPAHEVQIPFKWKDAFDRGSIFGSKIRLTIASLAYERVCVLFNIGALQSAVAASQSLDTDDGLKMAAKLFQQAAGVFAHLKANVMTSIHQEPTPDLNPETLNALSALMLAQAQEIFVKKAIQDKMKDAIVAKLCKQAEELYGEVHKLFQKDFLRPLWDRDWIPIVSGKEAAFNALAEYYQSLVCKSNKIIGEEIARLQNASELMKAAQSRSGRAQFFSEFASKIERNLNEAKKDNDFIYHERIPDVKSLTSVGKAMLAKQLPVPERFSSNFKDLFSGLCPVAIHQAMAAFDVRKGEIINTEISKLREATNSLNGILASLNLPAAIENTSGNELPPSLIAKGETIKKEGGFKSLQDTFSELPDLLQRNRDILDEADRMLNEEKKSDDQLREQFKEKWTRTPSEKLTESFRNMVNKYREVINNAVRADETVKQKLETHRRGLEILSMSKDEMEKAVPRADSDSPVEVTAAVQQLRSLMEDVATIKAEREVIESELTSATVDMKSTFIRALAEDGAISEAALSTETLGHVYGPLQKQVSESLQRQEALLSKIQLSHSQFVKQSAGQKASARDTVLKELAAAYDAFMELKNHLKEGSKFYNDLTQLLVVFQNKISDFCFARKTEKDELMKDLTQEASRPATCTMPPKPPVPDAPVSASTAPYPTGLHPGSMPMPYSGAVLAPYPAYVPPPMPQGYNPYATLPYPQQSNYGFPYPQQQQQGYPYPTQPGSGHQQNPHDHHLPRFSPQSMDALKQLISIEKTFPPYISINVIEKIVDSVHSYADSRGGGIPAQFR